MSPAEQEKKAALGLCWIEVTPAAVPIAHCRHCGGVRDIGQTTKAGFDAAWKTFQEQHKGCLDSSCRVAGCQCGAAEVRARRATSAEAKKKREEEAAIFANALTPNATTIEEQEAQRRQWEERQALRAQPPAPAPKRRASKHARASA